MRTLFVSDLHLSETRPAANEAFFAFLDGEARSADVLYILGDLFEYWIGDDDLTEPFNTIIAGALRELARSGVRIHVMHGNRDFLLGTRFCEAAGAQLLDDPTELRTGESKTLAMHGDTLCIDDLDYQAWRRVARSAPWQREFLAKSLSERRDAILALREKSQEVIQAKAAAIMDVNEGAVRETLRRHGASRLIHGHTHRPGCHDLEVDGRRCERWVLPDWYGRGGYLELSKGVLRLVRF